MPTSVIVLAAGQGTRMRSRLPKVLHRLAGMPLIAHTLAAADAIAPDRVIVVTGHGAAEVTAAVRRLNPDVLFADQPERLGTGHAVLQAAPALTGFEGDAIVLYGDTPFVRPETLQAMLAARAGGAGVVVLGFEAVDPAGYGRLVLDEAGALDAIVEERDATDAERAITLCNSGVIVADWAILRGLLQALDNDNAKGEYYLTGIVGLARARGLAAAVITCSETETLGVNSRTDLAAAEAAFQARARAAALAAGVTLMDPGSVWFALDTALACDVTVGPSVVFGPGVRVDEGATIHGFCHLEGCHLGAGAVVGPFARLRPGAALSDDVRIGNFVEVKNATLAPGAKVNHLSYIGDAAIGARTNVGAGTITCNYDGVFKHRTEIGADVFVGSNTALVAPVAVGSEALIAAGSVITSDVPEAALAVARGRQAVKPGLGRRIMDRLRALKSGRARTG